MVRIQDKIKDRSMNSVVNLSCLEFSTESKKFPCPHIQLPVEFSLKSCDNFGRIMKWICILIVTQIAV